MTFGPVSELRLSLVVPVLSSKIHLLGTEVPVSYGLGVTQGVRPTAEQAALYAQGRQSTAEVNALRVAVGWAPITDDQNIRVTDAAPGYSWHEFGMAVDVVPLLVKTNAPDWNVHHPIWQEIVQKGEALGMTSGVSWKDEPHFQWTCQYPETPNDEVRQLFAQGGFKAVWDSLKVV